MAATSESHSLAGVSPCRVCGHRRIFHHVMATDRGERREHRVPCSIPDCRCQAYDAADTDDAGDFERRVVFEGCFNFRDLGGYATTDGRWTRPRRLYRADGPHALTEADERLLGSLGLATIIDLRTGVEVERGSWTDHVANVTRHHLPMIDVVPNADEIAAWAGPETVAHRYRKMLDHAAPAVAEILAILSDARAYPAMFHCSAGKDRTGIVAAILLGIMLVPDETIVADYAISEAPMHLLVGHYRKTYPDSVELFDRIAPAMIAARPETMARLLAGIRDDYGTFDEFAAAIGVATAPELIREVTLTR